MVARVSRRSALPGPEWNPIVLILAVLACLCIVATISPLVGGLGLVALFVGVCVYAFMVAP
jgi:heme O synthase-like polyprenyltransferase